jgi:hypothetical protein
MELLVKPEILTSYIYLFWILTNNCGPVQSSLYSDSLRAGRSGNRIPVAERFFAALQTESEAYPTFCTISTILVLWGKAVGTCRRPPTPSNTEVRERVEPYFYSPSGPSWPVIG